MLYAEPLCVLGTMWHVCETVVLFECMNHLLTLLPIAAILATMCLCMMIVSILYYLYAVLYIDMVHTLIVPAVIVCVLMPSDIVLSP